MMVLRCCYPLVDAQKLLTNHEFCLFSTSLLWFHQLLLGSRAAGYSYLCQPVNYSSDVNEVRVGFQD